MRFSISRIKTFKACRRAFELRYIENLIPVKSAEALETGKNYHERLEALFRGEFPDSDDYSKEAAMVWAYVKYIVPKLKIVEVEKWVEMPIGENTLVGRLDGIADDGNLVEHKTTSMELTPEYEYDLQWDEQMLAYMLMTGKRKCHYTVCRKPTIRQKKGETEEDFFRRMLAWYDEDTDKKITVFLVERTDAEVNAFAEDLKKIADEITGCGYYYRNTLHCFRWGRRCEYEDICLHYDPEQVYVNYEKREEVCVNEGNENAGTGQFF